METIIARFKCQEGKEEEGFAALKEMVSSVKDNEDGCLAYICHRSKKNPQDIFFFEIYEDGDARKTHGKSDHMANMNKNFMKFFAPPVEIEELERIEGFSR